MKKIKKIKKYRNKKVQNGRFFTGRVRQSILLLLLSLFLSFLTHSAWGERLA